MTIDDPVAMAKRWEGEGARPDVVDLDGAARGARANLSGVIVGRALYDGAVRMADALVAAAGRGGRDPGAER